MLEITALFLLLPLAAATGWWLGRRRNSNLERHSFLLSSKYSRGLNYLLNEQPDKAIEVFLEIAEINRDTIETHLALGSLFRRRGEIDKAIRFHKHIMTRPNLSNEQRWQALQELGEDYLHAGLLDRAEKLFQELFQLDPKADLPARRLLAIYQQEKDWERAVMMAQSLSADSKDRDVMIAHFHCEIAVCALQSGDDEAARQALRQARRYDPDSPRPRLIEGDLAWQQDQAGEAIEHYRAACALNPDCTLLVLGRVMDGYAGLGRVDEAEAWLEQLNQSSSTSTIVLAQARLIAQRNPRKAADLVLEHMTKRATVRGLEFLMDLLVEHGVSLERVDPVLVRELLKGLLRDQPIYRCHHCGFSGTTHHWMCPSCRRWNTTRVIRGILGE